MYLFYHTCLLTCVANIVRDTTTVFRSFLCYVLSGSPQLPWRFQDCEHYLPYFCCGDRCEMQLWTKLGKKVGAFSFSFQVKLLNMVDGIFLNSDGWGLSWQILLHSALISSRNTTSRSLLCDTMLFVSDGR